MPTTAIPSLPTVTHIRVDTQDTASRPPAALGAIFDRTGTMTVHLKLTRAGKNLLGHSIHVDVTTKEIFTPVGRAPVVVVKRFVLG